MTILGSLRLGASSAPRARRKGTSVLAVLGLTTVGLAGGAVAAAPALAASTCPANRGVVTCTFGYTGGLQSWRVPAEATGAPIQIVATGQAGQRGYLGTQSAPGGLGAKVQGSFTLAAGAQLSVLVPGGGGVGGASPFGGGGRGVTYVDSGVQSGQAGAGGGLARVTTGPTSLVVAGGGGGGGAGGVFTLGQGLVYYFPGGGGGNAGLLGAAGAGGQAPPTEDVLLVTGGGGGLGGSTLGTGGAGGSGGILKPNTADCGHVVFGRPGMAGGVPILNNGGNAPQSGVAGHAGGGGGAGWGGGGSGGEGGLGECLISTSYGAGGGGGGGSSSVDRSAVAGSAAASAASGRTFADGGQVQISYRLSAPKATLTSTRWAPGGSDTGGILDHVDIAFDRPVTGLSASDFTLTRDGAATSLRGASVTGSGQSFTLGSLPVATGAEGHYVLTLRGDSGVVDARGTPLAADVPLTFVVDRTPPTLTFNPIASPRETPVDAVTFTLSDPLPGGLFDYPPYRLTRDGTPVTVPFVVISASSDRRTFTFGNLGGVTLAQGTYAFTVPASGIHDAQGNPLAADATVTWFKEAAPTASWDAVPTPRETGIDTATLRFSEPVTGVDLSDLRLFRDGTQVPLTGASLTGSGAVYTISGLGPLTAAPTTFSGYELGLRAVTGIVDLTGHPLVTNSAGLVFEVPVDPLTATFAPVVPGFRTTSVDHVALHFSRPVIRLDNFDFQLTRNGQAVPQSLFPITVTGSGSDYTISGLTAATTPEGTYRITLKNISGIAAGALPYRGTTSVGFTVDNTSPVVTITAPVDGASFTQGQAVTVHFTCVDAEFGSGVAGCNGGTLTDGAALPTDTVGSHTVSVSGVDRAGNGTTASVTYQVAPAPKADLKVTVSDSPDPVLAPGDDLTYSVTASNRGPDAATGVTVTDTLPSGATFVSASAGCTVAPDVNNAAVSMVTCAIGDLANGAAASRQIVVRAPAGGSLTDRASVTGDQVDPNSNDNTATEVTRGTATADLSVVLTVPGVADQGGVLTWTAVVTNHGPDTATGGTVKFEEPNDENVRLASGPSGCTQSGKYITCPLNDLASGSSTTIVVNVNPTTAGTLLAMVTVAADQHDPDPGQNRWARATYVNQTELTCDGQRVTTLGTAADDTLVGTPFADVIAGLGGNDNISGLSGDDRICGGDGADRISGGDGNDRLYGEGGDDVLRGDAADDLLNGGAAVDACDGGPGTNVAELCEGPTKIALASRLHVIQPPSTMRRTAASGSVLSGGRRTG